MSLSLDENLEAAGGGLQLSREAVGAIFLETVNLPEKRLKRFLRKNKEKDGLAQKKLQEGGLITLADLCNYPGLEDASLSAVLFIFEKYAKRIVRQKIQNAEEIFEDIVAIEASREALSLSLSIFKR